MTYENIDTYIIEQLQDPEFHTIVSIIICLSLYELQYLIFSFINNTWLV